ncbi:class I SAM-dependent methyltransferase [Candidatus Omnitrophota bacterium]
MDGHSLSAKQIRPEQESKLRHQLLNKDIESYFLDSNSGRLRSDITTSIPCVCGTSREPEFFSEIVGFKFVRCPDCGFLYINPRPAIGVMGEFFRSAETVSYFQTEILEHTSEIRRERIFRPRYEWLKSSQVAVGGRLLDVGCSTGIFLECFSGDQQFSVAGSEPNSAAVEICRRKGLEVRQATIEEFPTSEAFEVITGWEIIRHLVEPFKALSKLYQLLVSGGVLVLTTPNVTGFDFVLLGNEHQDIAPPMLLNGFTPLSMEQALRRVGFEIIELSTPGELDVEIVRKYWLSGGQNGRNAFLEQIILNANQRQRRAFQDYLSCNGLSSHLRVVARKK